MSIDERLAAITAFEEQIADAEALSEELEGIDDPRHVPGVLAMFERNAEQDDFGVFHAYANYLEQFDGAREVAGSTVGALIADSVRRAPMWKTCEILGGFVRPEEAAQALLDALKKPELSKRGRECVKGGLKDVLEMSIDEVSAGTAASVREALETK